MADEREKLLDGAMARHHYSGDALIETLHVAQDVYGYLSKPLLETVARRLRLPPSKVLGVATFYHLFRFAPRKAHTAVVCLGTPCYAAGAMELMSALRNCLAPNWSIEAGRCLGSCGLAPVVVCDGEALSRVTPAQLQARVKGTA